MVKKNINKIIISVIILTLIGAILAVLIFFMGEKRETIFQNNTNSYDITEQINIALDKLSKEDTMAEIITQVDTKEKVIALTFQGLSDLQTNEQILDLITRYNRKVDFFIPGVLVMEDSNFVEKIYKRGHRIGSNALLQAKNMEQYSTEELIDDFVRTNTIFQTIIKKKPTTLMCNSTIYTEHLLKAAYASGNIQVIQPTKFLNYQSFKDYNQVLNYVNKLEQGSIITIKMDGVLESDEYNNPPEPAKPAIDKQPGVVNKIIDESTPEEKLINMVNWFLKALKETNYKVVFVGEIKSYESQQKDFSVTVDANKKNSVEPKAYPIIKTNENFIAKPQKLIKNQGDFKDVSKQELDRLRKNNNGKKARQYRTIHTTEKALTYTFSGIENIEALDKVLESLDTLKAKGTFYITQKEIIDYPDKVKKIADSGHEIGVGLLEFRDKDFYSTLKSILFIQKEVSKLTKQTPTLVRYPYDIELSDEILEAVSSGNCVVMWQDISIASSKVGVNGTVEKVMDNAFGEGNITGRRGYVIYYRMNYYEDPNIIPDTMLQIARDKINTIAYDDEITDNGSAYSIRTAGEIMKGEQVYSYPLEDKDILPVVKDVVYPGHLSQYTLEDKFNLLKNRYIGNPSVSKPQTLPGFTDEELMEIDKTGVLTDDKVLFLTFDDWASDKAISQILYVLDKHNIKGSFFIRTNYMQNNPNILRAIAKEGHDVGSHTDNHLPFAIGGNNQDEDDTMSTYFEPNEEELLERKNDLLISYNKLQYVIGDISINNYPALTTIFRPPTLAMSRVGMEEILDMGFSHIVSGDFSTHDYEDTDPQVLADKIINGIITSNGNVRTIQNGSILIMHMSDFKNTPLSSPNVTAKALDIAIPILKSKGYSFAKLSDYLRED